MRLLVDIMLSAAVFEIAEAADFSFAFSFTIMREQRTVHREQAAVGIRELRT